MKTNIFIPEKINVGFRERNDTYTKKLAYIIYFDQKGVLRKETSWNSWRDNNIENEIHENIPTSGFVLNKKAGGYSTGWNHRQTYVRVYDPRGFEFEISVPNLLFILENTNSIKGKGLEGEFVYGWDGKDLVLIPTDSPDYIEISNFNKIIHEKSYIKGKNLKIGATYLTKDNQQYIYMGKFDKYKYGAKEKGKAFYFYHESEYSGFEVLKSLGDKIISLVSEECVENYADLFEQMERITDYSPVDESKAEYIPYTFDEVAETLGSKKWLYVYSDYQGEMQRTEIMNYSGKPSYYVKEPVTYGYGWNKRETMQNVRKEANSLEEIFDIIKPMWKKIYLANGKLYREEK